MNIKSNSFSKLFRKLRQEQKLKLRDIANRTNWSIGYIWDIENGRRNPPSSRNIIKLGHIIRANNKDLRRLLKMAIIEKGKVELDIELNIRNTELAVNLAMLWDKLKDNQTSEINKILVDKM